MHFPLENPICPFISSNDKLQSAPLGRGQDHLHGSSFPLGVGAFGTPPMSPWPGAAKSSQLLPSQRLARGKNTGHFCGKCLEVLPLFWGQPDNKAQGPHTQSSAWDQAGARPNLCLLCLCFPYTCFPLLPETACPGSQSQAQLLGIPA